MGSQPLARTTAPVAAGPDVGDREEQKFRGQQGGRDGVATLIGETWPLEASSESRQAHGHVLRPPSSADGSGGED